MGSASFIPPIGRTALAVAHPGHELRLAKWVELARPTVFILTSGSRSGADRSRVDASARLAETLGARVGGVFGGRLDRDVYGWIMDGKAKPFLALADELATAFVRAEIDTVVTDGWQLYNVVHDLWHLTVRLASAMAASQLGRRVDCLDYAVQRLRNKLEYTNIAYSLMPEAFTLSDLQAVYETIFGRRFDKRNFRRRMLSQGIIRATGKTYSRGAHRPAELFEFSSRQPMAF